MCPRFDGLLVDKIDALLVVEFCQHIDKINVIDWLVVSHGELECILSRENVAWQKPRIKRIIEFFKRHEYIQRVDCVEYEHLR